MVLKASPDPGILSKADQPLWQLPNGIAVKITVYDERL
jgi:hypothetical protein